MAIQQLTDEQIRTMTVEEKDRWWLENVYRGNMPQLTLRSALTGMMLGGLLSLTNLYIGMKTGWTLGVGITSVILAFIMFKLMSRAGLAREFTILENNCMQSIATAAGYMTGPLVASLAAYMLVTDEIIPIWQSFTWMISISILGVLFAFPLKRRFINDEQHPFPEGRAAGIVMDALHHSDAKEGMLKGKLLFFFGVGAAIIEAFKDSHEKFLDFIGLKALAIPHALEAWFLKLIGWQPRIMGTKLSDLTISLDPDHVMMAAGGLMGIRTGVSLLIGAIINYAIVAPWIIQHGDIWGVVNLSKGEINYGFTNITKWALWCGAAMMTTSSLYAFLSKPKMIFSAFSGMLGGKTRTEDCLRHIELPMGVFAVGIPVMGTVVVFLAHAYFDVEYWMGAVAVPMVFVFALIAANSTALTSITPTGALGKLTQLTYGILAPGNITTNLATAGITGEVASNASNLLMDIKPGYMLGGKPRHQAVGHLLGIFAGAAASVPVFYFGFLSLGLNKLVSDDYPMPGATVWRAVAELLTKGIDNLSVTATWAAIIGAVMGLVLEAIKVASKGRFPLSAVGIGLAFVIPFTTCFAMFLGSFIFWLFAKKFPREDQPMNRIVVQNQEPICAGVIAGGALIGISLILIENFLLS